MVDLPYPTLVDLPYLTLVDLPYLTLVELPYLTLIYHTVSDDADSTTSLPSISYPRSFNVGDLVWGPARGFPSWPGKLVPETEVRGNPKTENGKVNISVFFIYPGAGKVRLRYDDVR